MVYFLDMKFIATTNNSYRSNHSLRCPVCNESAQHRHFGGPITCNSCAIFFARSCRENRSYQCTKNCPCVLRKRRGTSLCKYCRFKACLVIQMRTNAVGLKEFDPIGQSDGYLDSIMTNMRSNFITRLKATVSAYGGQENYIDMSNKHCTPDSILLSTIAERDVLKKFLLNLELINYEHQKEGVTDEFVRCSLSTWITCHSLFTTIKQLGYRMGICYFSDCSYIQVNKEALTAYYNNYQFYFPKEVAKFAMDFYTQLTSLANRMHLGRVDDVEMAALMVILLLNDVIALKGPKTVTYMKRRNQMFEELRDYYEHHFEETAIRIGNLVSFIEEFSSAVAVKRDELLIAMRLNDRRELDGAHNFLWHNATCGCEMMFSHD